MKKNQKEALQGPYRALFLWLFFRLRRNLVFFKNQKETIAESILIQRVKFKAFDFGDYAAVSYEDTEIYC